MKRCPSCNQKKDWSEFHRNRNEEDGRHTYCKECMRPRLRQYKNDRGKKNREFLYRYLSISKCEVCGYDNPIALEFAHRENKHRGVTRMAQEGYALKAIKQEIRKCKILCANCHKLETYLGTYRSEWFTDQMYLARMEKDDAEDHRN